MNKKLNNNFSLRKLLLTALVSGPLATLPAPLWALPDVTVANLTTTAGVTTQIVGNTLNVTSPDKAVLTWQAFGSVGTGSITNSTIGANDIINYFLPTASGSVLNAVSGGQPSTISGQILSNGNVYILNPSGIIISPTAQINVGGFYASTVAEPAGYFGSTGTLSFAGTSNSNVVVQGTGVTGGTDTAQIQAVGTGNNIYLAGQAVDVQGGKFFGNLFVRASNASGTIAGMGGNNVRFGETGPVSINLVGAALTGGGLNITSNGGNVKLTGGTTAILSGSLVSTPVGTLTTIANGTGLTGYNAAPVVTISAPNAGGVQATATARVNSSGQVEGYTIVNAGSGYNGLTPTVTLSAATGALPVTATGFSAGTVPVVVTGDFISAITPNVAAQANYNPSPTVNITAPTAPAGVTAAATAIVNTSGTITGYAITNPGSGYTSAPTVTVASGTAVPGRAGITLAGVGLAAVTGQSQGSNYGTTAPTVTFSGGGGTGGIATATLTNGVVTGYSIVSAGSGYTSAPTVKVSAPTNGSLTFAPNVASTKGALTIDTNGNGVQGSITQGDSAIIASTSGQTVALNAGVGGNIALGAIDALTLGATGKDIAITDTAGDLTLNATTAAGTLAVTGAGSILQGTGTHSSVGAITLTPAAGKTVAFTATGDLTFTSIGSTSTITISTPGNVTFSQDTLAATNGTLSITSTGGTITAGAIAASSTLTISATSAAGRLTATSIKSATGSISVTGDISAAAGAGTTINNSGGSTLAITTTAGNITLGAITASSTLNLTATAGTISAGAISSNTLNISAPLGTVTATGTLANTNTATISSGTVTLAGISSTSNLTVTATTGNLTATSITTSSTLSLNAPSVTGTILTNQIVATSTQPVSLSSGGTLNLGGAGTVAAPTPTAANSLVTVPTLNLTSTAGSITQPALGVITSTGTVTITPFADATLTTATNDFNNVVLKGGAGGTTGTQVTDRNAINIANGTTALGNVTVTAGAGILTYAVAPLVTISSPIARAEGTAALNTNSGSTGTLLSLAPTVTSGVTKNGGGYLTAPTVTIDAPVNNANPSGLVRATATATINPLTGLVTGYTITNVGSGYTSAPTVTVSGGTAGAGGHGSLTTVTGNLSGGALSSVGVNVAGTAPYSAAPTVTIATNVTNGGASATAAISAIGAVSGVTPSQSGTITLGNAAIDVLSFAQNLTLTTSGISGGGIYSGLTTGANSVTVLGNVSLTGAGTVFNLGANTFGSAANYNFGQINAGLTTTGALTINETQTVNLGTITAGSLDARSANANIVNTGKITVGGTTVLAANSIFNPGDVTLDFATNAISGPIEIGNARDFSLTNTVATTVKAGSPSVNGKAATGAVNITVTGAGNDLTMTTQNGGDYGIVSFKTAGAATNLLPAVRITDPNGITLQNATITGLGTVDVTALGGPIVLGSGIALNTTGLTTLTSRGATAAITDSAPGIRIVGNVNMASDGEIAITQTGHSMGAVGLVTTGASLGVANASANITYTEGGTANLNVVSVNTSTLATSGGVLNVVSTGGSIVQTGAISVQNYGIATGNATFTSVGDVTLTNAGNGILTPIVISAVGNVSVAQAQNITLGNTTVTVGTFSADNSAGATKTITQAAGTTAKIYGASAFTTQGGKITLTNTDGSGNNFGAVSARTDVVVTAGNDIAITEGGTLNFAQVKAGTTGKLTAISTGGDIIQTTTGGVQVGGATALTSSSNVTLNLVGTSNSFGGNAGIAITAPGNVSLQDASAITALAGGTTIGGSLTLKNNTAGLNGAIKDLPGTIAVAGNVWFDTGTNATSSVTIGSSSITLGAVKFNSGTVILVENDGINIAPGTVASGPVSLTSSGNIITSGAGGGTFQNTLTLNATGSITITNPIFVVGAGSVGLVFRALGAVNLGAVSLAGNLNGIAPTSLGASTYTPPAP